MEVAGWNDPSPRLLFPLPYKDKTQTGRWQIPAPSDVWPAALAQGVCVLGCLQAVEGG